MLESGAEDCCIRVTKPVSWSNFFTPQVVEPLLFSIAAEEYLKVKEPCWEAKTRLIAGHFGLEDLRDAVETISRPAKGELDPRSPVNPPDLTASPNVKVN